MLTKSELKRLLRRLRIEADLDQRTAKAVASAGKPSINRAYESAQAQASGRRAMSAMRAQSPKRTYDWCRPQSPSPYLHHRKKGHDAKRVAEKLPHERETET
jgi:hypothetical protein